MTASDQRLMPLGDVLDVLRQTCVSKATGGFYIATDSGHWGEIVLDQGEIVSLRYGVKKGLEVVEKLVEAKTAKFTFKSSSDVSMYRHYRILQRLPSTEAILRKLANPLTQRTDYQASSPVMDLPPVREPSGAGVQPASPPEVAPSAPGSVTKPEATPVPVSEPPPGSIPIMRVLGELRQSCDARKTGAFFIATDKNNVAELVLDKGAIICLRCGNKKGMEAVSLLAQANYGRFAFREAKEVSSYREHQLSQCLPPTKELLQDLELQAMPAADPSASMILPTTPIQAAPLSDQESGDGDRESTLAAGTSPSLDSAAVTSKAKTVLVVEDSMVARKVITSTLAKNGYQVIEAGDGAEAMAQLEKQTPALLLLDLTLPGGMDGYKILSALRKAKRTAKLPVIILTSRDGLFDKLRGKVSGSNEYLTKPFSPPELLAKVEKYLK